MTTPELLPPIYPRLVKIRRFKETLTGTPLLLFLLTGCATDGVPLPAPGSSAALQQAQEQQDLQAGLNTKVLNPGEHIATVTP